MNPADYLQRKRNAFKTTTRYTESEQSSKDLVLIFPMRLRDMQLKGNNKGPVRKCRQYCKLKSSIIILYSIKMKIVITLAPLSKNNKKESLVLLPQAIKDHTSETYYRGKFITTRVSTPS